MSNTPLFIPYFQENGLWLDYRKDIQGNSFTWAWERPTTDVKYLAVHHSVTKIRSTWTGEEGVKKYADEIAKFHTEVRGWGGIGYHFVVAPDGWVAYVGDVGTARANVKDMNEQVIGICMIGDFTKHLPTDQQITSMHELTWWFNDQRAVWPSLMPTYDEMLTGHKKFQSTACPGSSWPIDMKWRIKTNTVYTPQPDPEPEDPEPPTTPDPTPGQECCVKLAIEVQKLYDRVSRLERMTAWDWVKGSPKALQEEENKRG